VEVVKMLLAHKDVDVNARQSKDYSPLLLVASYGDADVFEMLLAHKDVNVALRDRFLRTPLVRAASNGHERVVLLLQYSPTTPIR
jgi:ankyrin repeat protein